MTLAQLAKGPWSLDPALSRAFPGAKNLTWMAKALLRPSEFPVQALNGAAIGHGAQSPRGSWVFAFIQGGFLISG